MAPEFVPGPRLSERFYRAAVAPLPRTHFGDLPHTAARVGPGSEVLGFDTARSADHEWGPRLQVFLRAVDAQRHAADIGTMLAERLPKTFLGYPTNFVPTGTAHVRSMLRTDGPARHRVDVGDLPSWFARHLGIMYIDMGFADQAGNPVDPPTACWNAPDADTVTNCLRDNGIVNTYVDYQPADRLFTFQVIEFAIFTTLAAVAFVLALMSVRRRRS
ncbi:MAG: hypothetical protein LC635_03805 [Pseudonocardiaceae bacterium]|nr:hypothetical protein [Pseudonocardiaceae bacterium]